MTALRSKISVVVGDITKLSVDAIVNAANKSLLGGGGVDGAIHAAAGPELLEECRRLGGCFTGEAKFTKAYDLTKVKAIIHTVGPIVKGALQDHHKEQLAACYRNALDVAKRHELRSIAFPCISTGVYSFPSEEAANVAITITKDWLSEAGNADAIDMIIYCVFHEKDKDIYDKLLPQIFEN